jgi:hypothetical protein
MLVGLSGRAKNKMNNSYDRDIIMRCKVQLYVAGKVFYEEMEARDYKEAREVALARNPNAKVLSVTTVF